MRTTFSIVESLRFGWDTLKAHSALVFKVVLTILALEVAYQIVRRVLVGTAIGFLAEIVLIIALVVAGIGATVISLKLARHQEARFGDIIPPVELMFRYIFANLLAALITVAPVIVGGIAVIAIGPSPLAFIPDVLIGIAMISGMVYFMIRYSMVRFAVLDGKGITGSIRASAEITRGSRWHLLGFIVVMLLLNILGAILLLVGLLISMPVTMLAYAHVYTRLSER